MATDSRKGTADRIESAAWGLLFIWLGIVWLTHLSLGFALLGVAAVILGEQLIRRQAGLRVTGFWVFVGLCLALAGVWDWVGATVSLVPYLLLLAGAALLLSLFRPQSA
ncbi:hypothetical protein [Hyalangium gracile]|uniref:hypothetical protein n=1 Tax=Hyalangium gracile TaxID=394092 RepID=UPI001CC9EAD8|nr:hypothetical protein [Hyalangium gracile]